MKGAGKQTAAKGIVELDSLAKLDVMPMPVCTSENLGWCGFKLERFFVSGGISTPEKSFTSHVISITVGGEYKNNFPVTGGQRDLIYQRGEVLLLPAHYPSTGYDPKEMDLLTIYLEPGFVEQIARDLVVGERVELVPQFKLDDCFVGDISAYLLRETETNGTTGNLYAESLMTALAAKLIKNYSTARVLPHKYKGGLAKHKLRSTIEFINEHLSEDLSLNALAALCDLSLYHFVRVFKQSTGFTPHNYVMRERIERAKQLLRETNLTVTELAFQLGFADQPHFTKIFRQHTGATPTDFQIKSR